VFVAAATAARDAWTGELATDLPAGVPAAPAPAPPGVELALPGVEADHGRVARAWTASGTAADVLIVR
jgi:hypothetical protein